MYQIARLLISISPVIMGLYLLIGAFSNISAGQAATQWPTVIGQVIEWRQSSLFAIYDRHSYIAYKYEVEGNQFTGNRVAFGSSTVSGYKERRPVTVYYNPMNHSDAVLEVGFRVGYLFKVLVAVGLMLVGKLLWKRLE